METLLEMKELRKTFDGIVAVDGFSLSVGSGVICSVIGPNGAGKTTLFNLLTGFLLPDSGTVVYRNRRLDKMSPWRIAVGGLCRTFQEVRLVRGLSVLDNVLLSGKNQSGEKLLQALFTFSQKSIVCQAMRRHSLELLGFVGLVEKKDELAWNLSYGQQKLLSIACALATEPRVLLLDEPVSGVQPAMVKKIEAILQDLAQRQGKTVFFIEHNIEFVLKISDNIVVMDGGKKIAEGTSGTYHE